MSDPPYAAPERLETERLVVRCWRPGDGAALSEAVCASHAHLERFMPWSRPDQTAEEGEALVRRFRGQWLLAQDFVLSVWDREEGRVLGGTGFHLRWGAIEQGVAEIGMWIRSDAAHRGLGQHLLLSLVDWGFSAWPWQRLVWRCDTDNVVSRRVAEACGFQLEGVLRRDELRTDGTRRDTALYAALKVDGRETRD